MYFMIIPNVLAFQLSRDKVCRQNKIRMEMHFHDTLHTRLNRVEPHVPGVCAKFVDTAVVQTAL